VTAAPTTGSSDVLWMDATAQADAVAAGTVPAAELLEASVARIEALDPVLNAVVIPLFDRAQEAIDRGLPEGPLHGVPVLLKDFGAASAGDPNYQGMRALREAGWRAPADAHVTTRLRRAGAVVVGRTNTPELAQVGTTEPDVFGPTRNPWDLTRSPGGSSGGSAAAVAAGLVAMAHANDGGGSIRIPAAACGLVGLKPTRGAVSLGPGPESVGGFAVEGVVTRSLRDTALVLDVLMGAMPGDAYLVRSSGPLVGELDRRPGPLRVGVATTLPGTTTDPDPASAAERAALTLAELDHHVDAAWPAALEDLRVGEHVRTRGTASVAAQLRLWGERLGRRLGADDVEPFTWALAEHGAAVTAVDLVAALGELHAYAGRLVSWWHDGFDLLVTPAMTRATPLIGEAVATVEDPWAPMGLNRSLGPFLMPFNVSGQPAISLPLATSTDGLPVGVQLVAAPGREDLLVQVAAQLAEAHPWEQRRPPLTSADTER
jgi:amidase